MATKKQSNTEPEYLTTREAAEYSGLTRERITTLARTGAVEAMNDLWPGTRIKRLRISRASLDTYRANHSTGGRTRDSKLFVISIPNNLRSTVEQFLTEQGIELKRKNQPRPKSDPTTVEADDDGEETGDDDEDEE